MLMTPVRPGPLLSRLQRHGDPMPGRAPDEAALLVRPLDRTAARGPVGDIDVVAREDGVDRVVGPPVIAEPPRAVLAAEEERVGGTDRVVGGRDLAGLVAEVRVVRDG